MLKTLKKAASFTLVAVLAFGGMTLPAGRALAATTVSFAVTSGTDASKISPTKSLSGAIASLASSDDDRMLSDANWSSSYNEARYIEFVFSPNIPIGATIDDVTLYQEFNTRSSGTTNAKIEVWDGADFSHSHTLTVGAPNVDTTSTTSLTSYINTPTKVNSLKVRFLASVSSVAKTEHDLVSLSVTYTVNSAPSATAQSVNLNEDEIANLTLAGTDSDGTIASYTTSTNPLHGVLTVNSGTGAATYAPNANYYGSDSFDFYVTDNNGATSTSQTVSLTIASVNDIPVISSVSIVPATFETNDELSANVSASDTEGDTLTYSYEWRKNGNPIAGATGSTLDLSLAGNGDKGDSITLAVIANDGTDNSLEVVSSAVLVGNIAPSAQAVSVATNEDTAVEINFSGLDVDNDTLSYAVVTSPSHGTLGDVAGDKVTYTPDPDYNGPDSFTYKANDGTADSSPATVNITVNGQNDAPVLAAIGSKSVDEGSLLTFTASANDADAASTLTYSLDGTVPAGASIDPNTGVFTWTPTEEQGGTGSDFSVTIKVSDQDGAFDSEVISVTVNEVNIPPVASDVNATTTVNGPKDITLIGSDSDLPATTLEFAIVTSPSHGVLGTISGSSVTYTPALDFSGFDLFIFRVSDGAELSNIATATILVAGKPIASPLPGTYTTSTDVSLTSNDAVSIHFTTDGSDPAACSSADGVYSSPISVTTSTTIKAVSCYAGDISSEVGTYDYVISEPTPAPTPASVPQGGGSATVINLTNNNPAPAPAPSETPSAPAEGNEVNPTPAPAPQNSAPAAPVIVPPAVGDNGGNNAPSGSPVLAVNNPAAPSEADAEENPQNPAAPSGDGQANILESLGNDTASVWSTLGDKLKNPWVDGILIILLGVMAYGWWNGNKGRKDQP